MILGCKPQFKPSILSGSKIHSIREDKHKRWKAGRTIHFATGVRTKNYECFKLDQCKSTQSFELKVEGVAWFLVDEKKLTPPEMHRLAVNDGFSNIRELIAFFGNHFKGTIVHWTDFRYHAAMSPQKQALSFLKGLRQDIEESPSDLITVENTDLVQIDNCIQIIESR